MSDVPSGYKLNRDERGLTAHERIVLVGIADGKTLSAIGVENDLSRQRAAQLGQSLQKKGFLQKEDGAGPRGRYLVPVGKYADVRAIREEMETAE